MREYLLVLLTGLAVTFVLAPAGRSLALRLGAVARPRGRDVHQLAVPYFGGLAMFGGVAAAFLLASRLPFLSRYDYVSRESWAILGGAAVICLVGVLDDLFDLSPLLKAAGQVLAAGVTVLGGVRLLWIPWPGMIISLERTTSILVTVFVVFLVANAINFIDGLDGLAAGVVAIGAGAFFIYAYRLTVAENLVRATTASLVTVAICGVCLGYLPHNFHPAKMFMGDSGSMLLGLLMATSAISLTGQLDLDPYNLAHDSLGTALMPLILPLAVLALPLIDLALAFVRRTARREWWFKADKSHLHHRLIQMGHSHIGAVWLMYAWSALVAFGLLGLGLWPSWGMVVVVVVVLVGVAAVTLWPLRHIPPADGGRTAARQLAERVRRPPSP
ncbi:MAG: undecaprenyl/decaprenyl-phosphate alpha-N-acetylglucosaminyl 1-phosphate transferase [Propionibacteriaceae bacterium]|jgi:UDP-GlcNAc:undecaprenyl-phosphate GlcNAc-1-phosphate transferase|nr:undecaprenyl/decaprenyl-phosphate alpha-N-acetylglucosaminyl 1-phosphate transferase [Propionibacteriaceae bacterium]